MVKLNQDSSDADNLSIHQQVSSSLETYLSQRQGEKCYPGLTLTQGLRTFLQIHLNSADIVNILQPKPITSNNLESGKDRPEIAGLVHEIKQYVTERASAGESWLLGTITANVPPESITVVELGRGFCLVFIPHGTKLDITDGQHRQKAIEEIYNSSKADLIANDSFPITLILENEFRQCQRDFRDMAQAKPVDKSLLVSFGDDSGRVAIINNLIENVPMFKGKIERIKKTPPKNSKLIYTTNFLATFVSCVFANTRSDTLEDYNVEQSSQELTDCLNYFFSECQHTSKIAQTSVEKLTIDEITLFREECLLGVSIGIEVLARLLHCTYNKSANCFDKQKVLQLAQLDWSRDNELWRDSVVRIDPKNKKADRTNIVFGTSAVYDAVKVIKGFLKWHS